MRLTLLVAAATLSLAACKPAGEAPTGAEPPATAPDSAPPVQTPVPPVLNNVDLTQDLRAVGTEPFWAVEMTHDSLKFSLAGEAEATAPNGGPAMTPGTAAWDAVTADGKALKIVLTGEKCSDGMSDREYPLTAKVDFGDQHYKGCAATVAQLNTPAG